MSVNQDWNGLEFISTIEHRNYPFYGVQFHPEKNIYEWVRNKNISHSQNAIEAAQYFSHFFVNEARKSTNSFKNAKTEDQYVIYNFNVTFTGAVGSALEQCYMFPPEIDYPYNVERVKRLSDGKRLNIHDKNLNEFPFYNTRR
jgi:gamma-glutamyl hydrolase